MQNSFEIGAKIEVNHMGLGVWEPGKVSRDREGTCDVIFETDGTESAVDKKFIRLLRKDTHSNNVADDEVWVQCNLCNKWRSLSNSVDLGEIPEVWTCSMNTYDLNLNTCDAPEKLYQKDNNNDDDSNDDDDNEGFHVCRNCGKKYVTQGRFMLHLKQCTSSSSSTVNNNAPSNNTNIHRVNSRPYKKITAAHPQTSKSINTNEISSHSNKRSNTMIHDDIITTSNKAPRLEPQPLQTSTNKVSKQTLFPNESLYVVNSNEANNNQSNYHINILVRRLNNVSSKYHWLMNNNIMSLKIQDGGLIIRETESFTLIADFPSICIEKLLVITDRIVRIIMTTNTTIIANSSNNENAIAIQFPSSADQTSFMSYIQLNTDINCYTIDSNNHSNQINNNFNETNETNELNDIDYIRSHFVNPNASPSPYGISLVDLNDKSIQAYILLLLMSEEFTDFTNNLEEIIEQNMTRLPLKRRGSK